MRADVTSTDHFGVQTDMILVHAAEGPSAITGALQSTLVSMGASKTYRLVGGVDATITPSCVAA
eukprot:824881-Amphidinium_carterae.2